MRKTESKGGSIQGIRSQIEHYIYSHKVSALFRTQILFGPDRARFNIPPNTLYRSYGGRVFTGQMTRPTQNSSDSLPCYLQKERNLPYSRAYFKYAIHKKFAVHYSRVYHPTQHITGHFQGRIQGVCRDRTNPLQRQRCSEKVISWRSQEVQ